MKCGPIGRSRKKCGLPSDRCVSVPERRRGECGCSAQSKRGNSFMTERAMRTEPAQSHDRADSRVRFASLTPIAPKQSEGRARPGAPEYQMP